jgi:hypothetical protein
MTLLADLEAFVDDHHPHGGLTGDATESASNATDSPWPARVALFEACACGVVFERWVTPADADADLIRLASLN